MAALIVGAIACGSGNAVTDRVGNPSAPVTVTVVTEEHADSVAALMLDLFADEVATRSAGAVQVEVEFGVADGGVAWDQRAIERAADGDFDLVVARAGAWHALGVTTLDVLQLPGLVDTDAQADRLVSHGDVIQDVLAGLEPAGFRGLGLYAEAPRYLMLLDGSRDFGVDALRGRTVRTPRSETVFAVLRSFGMAPVDLSAADFLVEVSDGNVTMTEGQLARVELTNTVDESSTIAVGVNLPIYTKFFVLAARADAVDATTLDVLVQAARAITPLFAAARPTENQALVTACSTGSDLVHVPADDRAAFMAAGQVVLDAFERSPDGALLRRARAAAGSSTSTSRTCPDDELTGTTGDAEATGLPLQLPARRSDVVSTPGDLPDGVYRFTQTEDSLFETGAPSSDEPFIGEWILRDGRAEIHYFELDGTPMTGEPADTGGVYQVDGDLMIFATPPERAIPGTSGMYLLRWSMDNHTLALTQIDDGRRDADFAVPWVRVGDAPPP